MIVEIRPSTARGTMEAPPSKSMALRLLLCAGLSEGKSRVRNLDASGDVLAMLDCLRALGADIRFEETDKRTAVIRGIGPQEVIRAAAEGADEPAAVLSCRECGSTLRFLIPVCLLSGRKLRFAGSRKLFERPLSVYEDICREQGLLFERAACGEGKLLPGQVMDSSDAAEALGKRKYCLLDAAGALRKEEYCFDAAGAFRKEEYCFDAAGAPWEGEYCFLDVAGRLRPGRYAVPGNISSQFISGLLFALPLLEGDSVIEIVPPVESRPYIAMTMEALRLAGVRTSFADPFTIEVSGGQRYLPLDTAVEGDYSNAACFEALNLTGGEVSVTGLRGDSLQGDRIYRKLFEEIRSGPAQIDLSDCRDQRYPETGKNGSRGPQIDLSDCPDLAPILMAAAALFHGASFTGTRRLKFKESSRGEAMRQELFKLGVRTDVTDNRVRVFPGLVPPVEILDGHDDHRVVMALAVLLTKTGGRIRGAEAVQKSLPDFFRRLKMLGVDLTLTS